MISINKYNTNIYRKPFGKYEEAIIHLSVMHTKSRQGADKKTANRPKGRVHYKWENKTKFSTSSYTSRVNEEFFLSIQ